jgi:hypothetical protein
MSEQFSKSVKKPLQELVLEAHERALQQPLKEIADNCDQWRREEMDAIDLANLIHKFNNGPNREAYKRFAWSSHNDLPRMIAAAVYDGLRDEKKIPEDVMAVISRWLAFLQSS